MNRLYDLSFIGAFIMLYLVLAKSPVPPMFQSIDYAHEITIQMGDQTLQGVPVLTFDEPIHDFGTIKKGEKREHSFTFTNTGSADLKIDIVSACTCTEVDWPRQPIPPGEKGEIPVVFDSSTKDGQVLIDVDVIANTDPILVIARFKANVVPGDH
ncbi:MAG: DUF1573 domain-containing protein [Saprospiraceae bacterium]|nr:DUF1573 domain-containing protein [Saprospiraceae bacterium]